MLRKKDKKRNPEKEPKRPFLPVSKRTASFRLCKNGELSCEICDIVQA